MASVILIWIKIILVGVIIITTWAGVGLAERGFYKEAKTTMIIDIAVLLYLLYIY